LKTALEECQKKIEVASEAAVVTRQMGTTLTMAYILWPRLYVVHAGDSRCYLLRGSRLEQITTDHTVAQQLVERGALSPQEAKESRWSSVLWNCIGGGSHDLSPDVYKATLHLGDTLLLCSDGLTRPVGDEEIRQALQQDGSAEAICRRLVDAANAKGGPDNITVAVARFRDTAEAEAQAHEEAKAELATTQARPARLEAEPATVVGS
jgi:protein phosphatase